MKSLEESRTKINDIDSQIISLLEERMECVEAIGQWKRENSLPALNPKRENELLTKLASNTSLSNELISDIWHKIMSYAVGLQCNFRVAVVGGEDLAKAKGYFGGGVEVISYKTTVECLQELKSGTITVAFLSLNADWWQDIYDKYDDLLIYSSVYCGNSTMFTVAKLDKNAVSGNRTLVGLSSKKGDKNLETILATDVILLKHHREADPDRVYWLLQFNEFVEENSPIFQALKGYNVKLLGRYNILNQK